MPTQTDDDARVDGRISIQPALFLHPFFNFPRHNDFACSFNRRNVQHSRLLETEKQHQKTAADSNFTHSSHVHPRELARHEVASTIGRYCNAHVRITVNSTNLLDLQSHNTIRLPRKSSIGQITHHRLHQRRIRRVHRIEQSYIWLRRSNVHRFTIW